MQAVFKLSSIDHPADEFSKAVNIWREAILSFTHLWSKELSYFTRWFRRENISILDAPRHSPVPYENGVLAWHMDAIDIEIKQDNSVFMKSRKLASDGYQYLQFYIW